MNPAAPPETEAELEAFRQKWREELSARNKQPEAAGLVDASRRKSRDAGPSAAPVDSSSALRNDRFHEVLEFKAYHDLPDKEGQELDKSVVVEEPSSALEHYERAVEKETQGNLGESMRHYRKAFKLDDGVHEAYKKKHFPPSMFPKPQPQNQIPSNVAVTVPRTDDQLNWRGTSWEIPTSAGDGLPPTLKQLVDQFSALRIEAPDPASSLSPPKRCPIAELPEELLTHILTDLGVDDVSSLARVAQVCKRLAYLVLTEDSIWKHVAMDSPYGFPSMHYDFAVEVDGSPIETSDAIAAYIIQHPTSEEGEEGEIALAPTSEERRRLDFSTLTNQLLQTQYSSSYRQMFKLRPRIRFNGCYISTVNYTRAGANVGNTLTWGAPVHVVTYFRYLRFLRDGTCISLLTISEPADVVHYLLPENIHSHHGRNIENVPSAVMRDALRGRWRLSGPSSSTEEDESEGDLYVETDGVVPKYTYKMYLGLAHAGKAARNNKLAWKGFWSYNKLTDDWGKFELRNDRAFYWSRVRSYGDGL